MRDGTRFEAPSAIGIFYRRWPAAVRALITRRYPLDRFREPILESSGIKNVIVLDGNI